MQNAISVSFNNQSITAFMNGNVPVIAMKPIVENMGLDWVSQHKKINRHPILAKGMVMMTMPSKGGVQEMLCLPLKMLNGWLFGIDSSRVKAEIKDSVIAYQEKCFDVLADYFGMNQKAQPTESPKALPDYRTKLNKAVKHWVAVAQQHGSRLTYSEAWGIVHLRTGMVDGVDTATNEQLLKGLDVVGQALTGEYIPRDQAQIAQQPTPEPVTELPKTAEPPTPQPITVNLYPMIDYTIKRTEDWHANFEQGQHAVNNLVAGMKSGNARVIDQTFNEIKRNQLDMMGVNFCRCGTSVGYLNMIARYALIGMQATKELLIANKI